MAGDTEAEGGLDDERSGRYFTKLPRVTRLAARSSPLTPRKKTFPVTLNSPDVDGCLTECYD